MEQILLLFLTKYLNIRFIYFLDYFKNALKITLCEVQFFNTGNLHKNLWNLILKYRLDLLRATQLKKSSSS